MNRKGNFYIAALAAMVFALALGTGCSGTSGGAMTDGGPDFTPTGVEIVDPMDPMPETMDEETLVLYEMPETIYDSVIGANQGPGVTCEPATTGSWRMERSVTRARSFSVCAVLPPERVRSWSFRRVKP